MLVTVHCFSQYQSSNSTVRPICMHFTRMSIWIFQLWTKTKPAIHISLLVKPQYCTRKFTTAKAWKLCNNDSNGNKTGCVVDWIYEYCHCRTMGREGVEQSRDW